MTSKSQPPSTSIEESHRKQLLFGYVQFPLVFRCCCFEVGQWRHNTVNNSKDSKQRKLIEDSAVICCFVLVTLAVTRRIRCCDSSALKYANNESRGVTCSDLTSNGPLGFLVVSCCFLLFLVACCFPKSDAYT